MQYDGKNFDKVMAEHERWRVSNGTDGSQAVFSDVIISGNSPFFIQEIKKLSGLLLEEVIFQGVRFTNGILSNVRFNHCQFKDTSFNDCKLISCMFNRCNTEGMSFFVCQIFNNAFVKTILKNSVWSKTNIYHSTFKDNNYTSAQFEKTSNFYDTSLDDDAFNIEQAMIEPNIVQACPSHGSFIGWKKGLIYATRSDDITKIPSPAIALIQLEIPEDAERVGGYLNGKCRCSKAKVLSIRAIHDGKLIDNGIAFSMYGNNKTRYKVGEMVYPDSFDSNPYAVCSHGIHFFVSKENALRY